MIPSYSLLADNRRRRPVERRRQGPAHAWLAAIPQLPLVSVLILLVVLAAAVFAPVLAPHDLEFFDLSSSLQPPAWMAGGSSNFLLGADNLGHDIFSRILYGARVSLLVGFLAVGLAGTFGTALG